MLVSFLEFFAAFFVAAMPASDTNNLNETTSTLPSSSKIVNEYDGLGNIQINVNKLDSIQNKSGIQNKLATGEEAPAGKEIYKIGGITTSTVVSGAVAPAVLQSVIAHNANYIGEEDSEPPINPSSPLSEDNRSPAKGTAQTVGGDNAAVKTQASASIQTGSANPNETALAIPSLPTQQSASLVTASGGAGSTGATTARIAGVSAGTTTAGTLGLAVVAAAASSSGDVNAFSGIAGGAKGSSTSVENSVLIAVGPPAAIATFAIPALDSPEQSDVTGNIQPTDIPDVGLGNDLISPPKGSSNQNPFSASGPITGMEIVTDLNQQLTSLEQKKEQQFAELTPQMNFPYIDAGQVTSVIPTAGIATYNGLLSGNSTGSDGVASVSGTIRLTVDFASLQNPGNPSIAAQLNFANGMGSATGNMTADALLGNAGSPGLSGTFRGESITTGSLRNSQFFGPGANEFGGDWDVQTNNNIGSGAYQSAR